MTYQARILHTIAVLRSMACAAFADGLLDTAKVLDREADLLAINLENLRAENF